MDVDFDSADLIVLNVSNPSPADDSILAIRECGNTAPINALSGVTTPEESARLAAVGADGVLSRLVPVRQLLSSARQLLGVC